MWAWIAWAAWLSMAGVAAGQNPFDVARQSGAVVDAWVGPSADVPPGDDGEAATPGPASMLDRARGRLGVLSAEAVGLLRRSVDLAAPVPGEGGKGAAAEVVVTIRVRVKGATTLIEAARSGAGYVATPLAGTKAKRAVLKAEVFDRALAGLMPYWGPMPGPMADEPEDGAGAGGAVGGGGGDGGGGGGAATVELRGPLAHGRFGLDEKTLERVQGGRAMYPPTSRVLSEERLWVRLPTGYEPRWLAGVLVWIDPMMEGKPPAALHAAADEFGLIIMSPAKAGNQRAVVDRLQLALDAAATASRRWLIDPERVYVAGLSGGGKMSSILLAAFPEVFTGAMPIVGLSWYLRLPTGEPGKFWAPEFAKPEGARWKKFATRRLGVVTGPGDFNYEPIRAGVALFEKDKLSVRLFDVPGLGHEMPGPEALREAVAWIDEPGRAARFKAEERATAAADALPSEPEPRRQALRALVLAHPWTRAAWAALDELGGR